MILFMFIDDDDYAIDYASIFPMKFGILVAHVLRQTNNILLCVGPQGK